MNEYDWKSNGNQIDIEMKINITNMKAFQAFFVDKKGIARNENAFVYGLLFSAHLENTEHFPEIMEKLAF